VREARAALTTRDAARATERAEALRKILQEAGAGLYAQTTAGPQARPDVGAATGEPRPTGAGPRGRVVDAEYREAKGP
jgi:molecular chaperone DnaK